MCNRHRVETKNCTIFGTNMDYNEFFDMILRERKRLGISQNAMAKYCGVSRGKVVRYELRMEEMPSGVMFKYCEKVGVGMLFGSVDAIKLSSKL
jgi:transcriptional regulator with XRE-family HTH domain